MNFSLRFVYEFFLDICICVFINLAANGVDVEGADLSWSISLILNEFLKSLAMAGVANRVC